MYDLLWFAQKLLEIDGKTIEWNGHMGFFYNDENKSSLHFALRRLQRGAAVRSYDSSGMGPGFL